MQNSEGKCVSQDTRKNSVIKLIYIELGGGKTSSSRFLFSFLLLVIRAV